MTESSFQSGQITTMGFLFEAMARTDFNITTLLTECIMMATICGRNLRH